MSSLPTLTLPLSPGEYAYLQLPRHLSETEYAYLKHLLDVMSLGFITPPVVDDETEPVPEWIARSLLRNTTEAA
jgi:hypothetical protein